MLGKKNVAGEGNLINQKRRKKKKRFHDSNDSGSETSSPSATEEPDIADSNDRQEGGLAKSGSSPRMAFHEQDIPRDLDERQAYVIK